MDNDLLRRIMYIPKIALNHCESSLNLTNLQKRFRLISKTNLESVTNLLDGDNIQYILIDEYYKGIGILTKDDLIKFTKPFGIQKFPVSIIKKIENFEAQNIDTFILQAVKHKTKFG